MTDLYQALDLLLDALSIQASPYALIGGIAVRAHAIPRNTNDIDVVVTVPDEQRIELFQELADKGFEVPQPYFQGGLDRVKGMPVAKVCVYLAGRSIDVDLFFTDSAFQQSVMARRMAVEADGRPVWIASAEDVVILKLLAARPRDLLDVVDILFICGQLDVAYLRSWADQLDVRSALEDALKQAGQ